MKYVFLIVSLVIIFSGCMALGGSMISGQEEIFEGSGIGYRGAIRVQVRIHAGSITEIIVVDSMEDRFVGEAAMEELIDTVIEYNSTDVDAVSGATVTSKGFLDAVNNAIMRHE